MATWSIPAKYDLKNIHDYIAMDSKYYALKVTHEFVEKTEVLNEFPQNGKIVSEIDDPLIRELSVYSYRLIYQISKGNIEILAIIHGKQNFQGDFDEIRK